MGNREPLGRHTRGVAPHRRSPGNTSATACPLLCMFCVETRPKGRREPREEDPDWAMCCDG